MKARVLIADDHELVRTGIQRLLEDMDCDVVAAVASGEEAADRVQQLQPDIALIDIHMPGIGGLEASQRVQRFYPDCRVIILTAHTEGPLPRALLETGVAGFLTKGCASEEMQAAIRKVRKGERYLSHTVAQDLAFATVDGAADSPFNHLTARELQITLMLVAGEQNRDISQALQLSPKTVTTYRGRIFRKMAVRTLPELLRVAMQYDLIAPEQPA
jgi:two-component system invasion response regulator UvrY